MNSPPSCRFDFWRVALIVALGFLVCTPAAICRAEPRKAGSSSNSQSSQSSDENARLQALFRKGITAYEAGNDQESLQALSEAWAIRQTYDIAAALAQTELSLKRYRDAAEHLDFGLKHFVPGESEKILELMRTAYADAKQHVAALKIEVARNGATIDLDGRTLGVSPLPSLTFVDPGEHTLQARDDRGQVSQRIDVLAGQEYPVTLELDDSRVRTTGELQQPRASASKRSLVPFIIGSTAAVIGTVGLVTFSSMASSDAQTMKQLAEKNGPYGCTDGSASASDCAAQQDAANSHDKHRNLAVVSAVVGAVAVVSIPLYWFWPRPEPSASPQGSSRFNVHGAVGLGRISLYGKF